MTRRLLVDTDVLIDYLRGNAEAVAFIDGLSEGILVSAVTVAELFAGVREGKERRALEAFIAAFDIVPVDGPVAIRGGLYRRDHARSHNTGIADALIAASAVVAEARLVTLNEKHFPMLSDVHVPYRKLQGM
jgi:predicted nucleic acid-binding protein